jgi:hypothetical protein
MWSYLRIDRLPQGARCTFCSRELRSGKGIVVADDSGTEHYSGPSCAKAHIGESEERILDVSRIALCVVIKEAKQKPSRADPPVATGDSGPKSGGESDRRPPSPPLDRVETYVRLRCEMMAGFKAHASTALKEAHQELEASEGLGEASRSRISGLMRNAERDNSIFSDANVRRCIAVEFWLRLALDHVSSERSDFLKGMLSTLHSRWQLSPGQISGVNRWGLGLRRQVDDFPLLDEHAFSGVILPDFMHQKTKKT